MAARWQPNAAFHGGRHSRGGTRLAFTTVIPIPETRSGVTNRTQAAYSGSTAAMAVISVRDRLEAGNPAVVGFSSFSASPTTILGE